MTACIVGWSHLAFGRRDHDDVESMICSVASEAIKDSGFGPADIDAIYLGHFGGAFSPQGFTSSLVFQSSDALRFKPATRVENACATVTRFCKVHGPKLQRELHFENACATVTRFACKSRCSRRMK